MGAGLDAPDEPEEVRDEEEREDDDREDDQLDDELELDDDERELLRNVLPPPGRAHADSASSPSKPMTAHRIASFFITSPHPAVR